MGDARGSGAGGFWSFYRRYTDTGVHTATMAGLTAFGLLTFVHRAFVVVAVGVYVLPPILLYLTGRTGLATGGETGTEEIEERGRSGDDAERTETPRPAATDADREATGADDGSADAEAHAKPNTDDDEVETDAPAEWVVEATPTDATLRDATALSSGAVAVGDGGAVVGRDDANLDSDGGTWSVLVSDGPAAEGRDLTGVDATDDGAAAWLCGANGAAGRYDAETGRHADHSAPRDVTDSWTDVAVAGRAGEETVYLANGSGEIVRGRVRDGDVSWDPPVTPGSGSSVAAVDAAPDGGVWACDTAGGAFESADGGETFARVGVDGASGTFTDVTAGGDAGVRVSADDGSVYRDDAGWTRDRPVETRLAGVDAHADTAVTVGDAGIVCVDGGGGWEASEPTDVSLEGVHLDAEACTAVGDDGTVLRVGGANVGRAGGGGATPES